MKEKTINVDSNSGVVANNIEAIFINPIKIKKSVLADLLKKMIDNNIFTTTEIETKPIAYDISQKINYNNVIKYKELINQNTTFFAICENVMDCLDDLNSGAKTIILQSVHNQYIVIKGNYLLLHRDDGCSEMDVVKLHSDEILNDIFEYYYKQATLFTTLESYQNEEVLLNIQAFLTYCFIECKILEKP